MTEVPDLRQGPPRRWNVELEGVAWLPRLIDKARAAQAGTLGAYLYGQSPTDKGLLHTLGLNHKRFLDLVTPTVDDAGVLAALQAHDPACLERGRSFSADLRKNHKFFLWMMDVDDGYNPALRWVKPAVNGGTGLFTAAVKRVFPVPNPAKPGAK